MAGQNTNQSSRVAVQYARALLELAQESNRAEVTAQELSDIVQIVRENRTLRLFLIDPAVGIIERGESLRRIFGGRVPELLMNLLLVLNEKGRLGLLDEISAAYDDLLGDLLGKIEVDVIVAHKLPPEQLEVVRRKVSQVLGKDAVVHQYVDESVIGGLVLRVGDKLIDASVRSQLRSLRVKLMNASVPDIE